MKQVFATAAMAGVTSAWTASDMWNKMIFGGQTYRQRDGVDDPASYVVVASTSDDGQYGTFSPVYAPETGTQTKEEFVWALDLASIVNEDSGESILIMTNWLLGKILHTDVITFDIKFTSASDVAVNAVIGPSGFDQATCQL